MATIRNPIEWGADHLRQTAHHFESMGRSFRGAEAGTASALPAVRRITVADLRDALAKGMADFAACRTDVVFLCIVYPVVGLLLAHFAFNYEMLPLLFPIASGFALLGPVAAVGLYEMSRRREQGAKVSWADAFGAVGSPSFGPIVALGILLLVIFLLWLTAAQLIYMATLGPEPPTSAGVFMRDVFMTAAGWSMIVFGTAVGFVFAVLVLAISAVSFPLLLDRDVGLGVAVVTSLRVFAVNPGSMMVWGMIVVAGLVIGSIPMFLGLIFIMPALGHATWHLYRKAVGPS